MTSKMHLHWNVMFTSECRVKQVKLHAVQAIEN